MLTFRLREVRFDPQANILQDTQLSIEDALALSASSESRRVESSLLIYLKAHQQHLTWQKQDLSAPHAKRT